MPRLGMILTVVVAGLAAPQAVQAQAPTCRPEWPVFGGLAGAWRVQFTYRRAPGEYETSDATAVVETDPGRCVMVERLDASAASRPMRFLFVTGFAHVEASERVYYDTEHARFLIFSGDWNGETATFERSQQMNANRVVNRTEVRPVSADAFTVETQLSTNGGQTWALVQRMEYRRASSAD